MGYPGKEENADQLFGKRTLADKEIKKLVQN